MLLPRVYPQVTHTIPLLIIIGGDFLLNLEQLISDFEACIGFPYASPGTNDERGIDCSGMFVRAFRRQGASIYHGSNTIFRKYLARSGTIASAADLRPGMAVFKWKPVTPARFSDGLGDFCHIGLVTSVSPLRIVHASTAKDGVKISSLNTSYYTTNYFAARRIV